jgi:hypothetical protein
MQHDGVRWKLWKGLALLVALLLVVLVSGQAGAGQIKCEPEVCGWEISVNGEMVSSGDFTIAEDGSVGIGEGATSVEGDGYTVSLGSLSGHVDPELVFGLGATNSSNGVAVFAFAFNLPLGGFNFGNAILTEAALGTTLTASSQSDANLFPVLGVGKIVDSQDIQFNPFASVDKGVDIGDALVDPAGGVSTLRNELVNGIIAAGNSFDLMTVTVAFGLASDDQVAGISDQVGVGFSGRVTQVPVPEPGTGFLLALGLAGLAWRLRRHGDRAMSSIHGLQKGVQAGALALAVLWPFQATGTSINLSGASSDNTPAEALFATLEFDVVGSVLRLTVRNRTDESNVSFGTGEYKINEIYFNATPNVSALSLTSPATGWSLETNKKGGGAFGRFDFALIGNLGRGVHENVEAGASLVIELDISGTGPFDMTDFASEPSRIPPGTMPSIVQAKFVQGPGDDSAFGASGSGYVGGPGGPVDVPEPGAALLVAAGLIGTVVRRWPG